MSDASVPDAEDAVSADTPPVSADTDALVVVPDSVLLLNSNPGELTNGYVESIYNVMLHNIKRGDDNNLAGIKQQPSGACIATVRDGGMEALLDSTAEWGLWLDSDISVEPHIIQQMIADLDFRVTPVVSGLYVTVLDVEGVVPCAWDYDSTVPFGKSPLVVCNAKEVAKLREDGVRHRPIAAAGAGCLLVHRSLVEAMKREYGARWFLESEFHGVRMGEDFSFFMRVQAMGVQAMLDVSVTTHHKKPIYLSPEHLGTLTTITQSANEANEEIPT